MRDDHEPPGARRCRGRPVYALVMRASPRPRRRLLLALSLLGAATGARFTAAQSIPPSRDASADASRAAPAQSAPIRLVRWSWANTSVRHVVTLDRAGRCTATTEIRDCMPDGRVRDPAAVFAIVERHLAAGPASTVAPNARRRPDDFTYSIEIEREGQPPSTMTFHDGSAPNTAMRELFHGYRSLGSGGFVLPALTEASLAAVQFQVEDEEGAGWGFVIDRTGAVRATPRTRGRGSLPSVPRLRPRVSNPAAFRRELVARLSTINLDALVATTDGIRESRTLSVRWAGRDRSGQTTGAWGAIAAWVLDQARAR